MKYFILILFLSSFFIQDSFALCVANEDWPEAPCMDSFPVNRAQFQADWAPYYDYKGAELMDAKYTEMHQAISNETFSEWLDSKENWNVYYYYLSIGEVPNQLDSFIFDDEITKYTYPDYFVILGIAVIIISSIVITWVRIRK